jgi:hypothetical protein
MTVTYPFQRANALGYALFEELPSAHITQIDENAAAAADGRVYSDVQIFANFPFSFTDTTGGEALVYSPSLGKYFSFGAGTPPTGFSFVHPGDVRTALTIPTDQGLGTNFSSTIGLIAAIHPSSNLMLLTGAPVSSSQLRYRTSIDGTTWTSRTSNKSAGTDGPFAMIYAGGAVAKFVSGYSDGSFETSADGITWSAFAGPDAIARSSLAYSPTLGRLVSVSDTATNTYTVSTTVTLGSFTNQTGPANFDTVWWSSYQQAFYAVVRNGLGVYKSSTGLTGSWSAVGSLPFTTASSLNVNGQLFEWNRLLVAIPDGSGEVAMSIDGAASWKVMAQLTSSAWCKALIPNGPQLVIANGSTGVHRLTQRHGFF